MVVEIINTGSELMLGRVLNTHQQWLCRQLADLGYIVSRQTAIADTAETITHVVKEALGRADLIITTGGLGPTSDDITRDLIADLLGRKLVVNAEALQRIEKFFAIRKRPMPERTAIQARVPEGAIVLQNDHGTAPGLAMETASPGSANKKSWLIMLPGPPRELRPMFTQSVLPLLRQRLPHPKTFVCRTLRSTGIGESQVEAQVDKPLAPLVQRGLELGYCARTGQVDVRLGAHGSDAASLVAEAESIVRGELKSFVYGIDDEELEFLLVARLTELGQTVALAESCTGGAISHRITNVPGASAVLLAGLVTYSNAAKQNLLGVRAETLSTYGAVSEATAAEMATGARNATQANWAISVTGIAGPSGGTEEKPVGTVFIGLAGSTGIRVRRFFNPYDRETFKLATGNQALDLLRRAIISTE